MEMERIQLDQGQIGFTFAGQRPSDALGLGRDASIDLLLTCEGGPAAHAAATQLSATLVALEDRAAVRRPWTNLDVPGPAAVVSRGRPFLAYATSRRLERLCLSADVRPCAPPAMVKELWDDKIRTRHRFARAGLPALPWQVVDASSDYRQIEALLGAPFILQPPAGSSGIGTLAIDGQQSWVSAMASCDRALATRYADGPLLNVHGVVGADAVAVGTPSVQLAGTPGLAHSRFAYCGNDLAAAGACPAVQADLLSPIVRAIGEELADDGWRGIFGVDLIEVDGMPIPIEVNPRLQGSSALVAEAEAAAGAEPLGRVHRRLMLDETDDVGKRALPRDSPCGSALVMHAPREGRFAGQLRAGLHELVGEELVYTGPALGLSSCSTTGLVVEGPPRRGQLVHRGAVLARVVTWREVTTAGEGSLTPFAERLVGALRTACGLRAETAPFPARRE